MNYNEFIDALMQNLFSHFNDPVKITFEQIEKNNGVHLDAILIRDPKLQYSPTIYLRSYFERFTDGETLDSIVSDICEVYANSTQNPPVNFQTILEKESVCSHLTIQLVNYQKNESRLKNMPHIRYLDLGIIFLCRIRFDDETDGTFPIRYEHLKLWELTVDDLKEIAFQNMITQYPLEILSIKEMLKKMMETDAGLLTPFPPEYFEGEPPFYVLSNSIRHFGASAILYPDVLEEFSAKVGQSLFILPSSVHEMLLFPDDGSYSLFMLSNLLREVNSTQLLETELLSDNVYYYDASQKAISQMTTY